MSNITLPDEAAVRAVDQSAFVTDDLMDGLLTDPHGAVIKLVVESLDSGDIINIHEMNAGTGKTAKFIVDNCSNQADLKIATTDIYNDTYLTTSEYFDTVANASNVYKNDTSSLQRTNFDEGGSAISVDSLDAFGANANAILSTVTLADSPTLLGVNDLASFTHPDIPNSHVVNHAGTAIDSSGNFDSYNLGIYYPWPVSMGFAEHEKNTARKIIASMFNRTPSGGGFIIFNFQLPFVQTAFWDTMNAMTNTGKFWTSEWVLNSETDNSGYWQAAIIKKT